MALTLSLEHEGDVQVVFTLSECEELILRLQQAVSDAQGEIRFNSRPASGTTNNNEVVTR